MVLEWGGGIQLSWIIYTSGIHSPLVDVVMGLSGANVVKQVDTPLKPKTPAQQNHPDDVFTIVGTPDSWEALTGYLTSCDAFKDLMATLPKTNKTLYTFTEKLGVAVTTSLQVYQENFMLFGDSFSQYQSGVTEKLKYLFSKLNTLSIFRARLDARIGIGKSLEGLNGAVSLVDHVVVLQKMFGIRKSLEGLDRFP